MGHDSHARADCRAQQLSVIPASDIDPFACYGLEAVGHWFGRVVLLTY